MNADKIPSPPRRAGTPLGERPTTDGTSQPPAPAPAEPAPSNPVDEAPEVGPTRRHVWVAPADGGDTPHAGIVHAWRRTATGWQARCTYIVDDTTPEGVAVTQWLAAEVVRPV